MGAGLAGHVAASLDGLAGNDLHLGGCTKTSYGQQFEAHVDHAMQIPLMPLGPRSSVGGRARSMLWTAFMEPHGVDNSAELQYMQYLTDPNQKAHPGPEDDFSNAPPSSASDFSHAAADVINAGKLPFKGGNVALEQAQRIAKMRERLQGMEPSSASHSTASAPGITGPARIAGVGGGSTLAGPPNSPADVAGTAPRSAAGAPPVSAPGTAAGSAASNVAGTASGTSSGAAAGAAPDAVATGIAAGAARTASAGSTAGVAAVARPGAPARDDADLHSGPLLFPDKQGKPKESQPALDQNDEPPENAGTPSLSAPTEDPNLLKDLKRSLSQAHERVSALSKSAKELHDQENAVEGVPPDPEISDKPLDKPLDRNPDPSHTDPIAALQRQANGGYKQGYSAATVPRALKTPSQAGDGTSDAVNSSSESVKDATDTPAERATADAANDTEEAEDSSQPAPDTSESSQAVAGATAADTGAPMKHANATGKVTNDVAREGADDAVPSNDKPWKPASTDASKGVQGISKDAGASTKPVEQAATPDTHDAIADASGKPAEQVAANGNSSTSGDVSQKSVEQDAAKDTGGATKDTGKAANQSASMTRDQRMTAIELKQQEKSIMDQQKEAMQDQLKILKQIEEVKRTGGDKSEVLPSGSDKPAAK